MSKYWVQGSAAFALILAGCANSSGSTPSTSSSESGASATNGSGGEGGAHGGASGVSSGAAGAVATTGGAGGVSNPGASGAGGLPVGAGGLGLGGSSVAGAPAGAGVGGSSTVGGGSGTGGTGVVACPGMPMGIPIVPDAGGLVAIGSNSLGIHGSWFVYSDCPDQKGKPCSTVTTPAASMFTNVGGKMCTSGMTSNAAGAWGAGIALELNDKPPQQPYDTTANGIKGFCMVLSGPTLPSTGLRVAFPTKNNPDYPYFEAVTTAGPHTVLFADAAQGSWAPTKTAFEPTQVMLLQLQIPSVTTAPVAWDFCVEGLTAIVQ